MGFLVDMIKFLYGIFEIILKVFFNFLKSCYYFLYMYGSMEV